MDPLSIIAGVVGISAVAVKLISQLSEFVDDVKNSSNEVQALANSLASFYSFLGQIKLLLTSDAQQVPDGLLVAMKQMIPASETTLRELEKIIRKAKNSETDRSATRVWRTVRFTFQTKQVDALRGRIGEANVVLEGMIVLLVETRAGRIENKLQLLDEIRDKVNSLVRQNVKEVLVVLEREDETDPAQRAEFILKDKTSRNRPSSAGQTSSIEPANSLAGTQSSQTLPNEQGNPANMQDEFLNCTTTSSGQAAFAGAAGHMAEHSRKQKLGIGTGFTYDEQMSRARFELTNEQKRSLETARTKTWPILSAEGRGVGKPESEVANVKIDASREGFKTLRMRILLQEKVHVVIENEKGHTVGPNDGGVWMFSHFIASHKIIRGGSTVGIVPRFEWEGTKNIPGRTNELHSNDCFLKYVFSTDEAATEMHTCIITLQKLWIKVWELHTIAFSNIDPTINVDNEEHLGISLDSETSRWTVFNNKSSRPWSKAWWYVIGFGILLTPPSIILALRTSASVKSEAAELQAQTTACTIGYLMGQSFIQGFIGM